MTLDEFRSHLKRHNFNLREFSAFINMEYSTVSKWGRTNPVPPWITKFFDIYDELQALKETKSSLKNFLDLTQNQNPKN
jgi:hypothetical protein